MRLWPLRRETPSDPLDSLVGLFQEGLTDFGMPALGWSSRLQDRVWVANRCLQMTCQHLRKMPLRFFGTYRQPAWVSSPDPVWYPSGIGSAVFSAAWSYYGHGDAFLYVTNRYADGYPSAWTVLDPAVVTVQLEQGQKVYRTQEVLLDPDDVVQISRDPRPGWLRGTPALQAYSSLMWGMLGITELARSTVSGGGSVPNAVLKSTRKLTGDQAKAIQDQWIAARARSQVGAPAILDPTLSFEQLSFSAQDLMLLELQEYDARAIATAFGVPAMLLNLPIRGGLAYQNPDTLFEVWWRQELEPTAVAIQQALSAHMLPNGSWVEFDARASLAPTFAGLVSAWMEMLKGGVVTVDEVRAAVPNLPPLAEGEALDDLTEPPSASARPEGQDEPVQVLELLHPTAVSSAT